MPCDTDPALPGGNSAPKACFLEVFLGPFIQGFKLVRGSSREPKEEPERRPGGPGGALKQLGGSPLALLPLSGPPGLPFSSSLGSLELPQTSLRKALL